MASINFIKGKKNKFCLLMSLRWLEKLSLLYKSNIDSNRLLIKKLFNLPKLDFFSPYHLNLCPFWQESRLKVSNLLSICYFDDGVDVDGKPKQYAHINFNADAGSESVLVFAELSKTVDGSDPWALSSCKKLTKNSHGDIFCCNADRFHVLGLKAEILYFCCISKNF
jgi:hypothetical protein